ncbi:LacI family DNA-binding transcriptional regulator [Agromyces sp. Leaf222]|uniref:LacI family DNA-binding transcriptional regulator n=1 Tax=Agromyces sp. Leaf222 TaxID=1735688 RepID=UPI0006FB4B23|nr:LacI family DNA-binding transcriptional regulator [Agromyces sp. Leaf222]KQM82600.1 hypothetical protein ASE68_04300 [Agromyces sp. Leaf222]
MKSRSAVPTLQDVADRAGVARATASLALNGKGRMSEQTRQRVRTAADELNYVVNVSARNLRTARSGAVGIYIPDHTLSSRYYMDVAFGAVEQAQSSDLLVTLMPTAFAPRSGITEHLDGFIMVDPMDGDPIVERLLRGRAPVVSGEGSPAGLPSPFGLVQSDHRAGMRVLLDHLWEHGSRHPACILPDHSIAWGRQMHEGYADWCAERGIEPRLAAGTLHATPQENRELVAAFVADLGEVDAIVGGADGVALMALDALREAGIEVGPDMMLASYVDGDALAVTEPSITALDLAPRDFGRRCMDLLAGALDGTIEAGATVEMPVTLIPRASTMRVRTLR